uniref:Alpha-galactosidase n=1 Tax=Syphacia muris TaxID=451379 RepID=A0A158R5H7_9BILA
MTMQQLYELARMVERLIIYCLLLHVVSVVTLENGLARTPPMGWMSWAKFFCQTDCQRYPFSCINEGLYTSMADRLGLLLIEDGYAQVGYNTIHIDDCWMEQQRDIYGRLIADRQRFPSGIAALADYMHRRGLKLGIYGDYGTKTCAGYPGSLNYLKMDADTFASWNVDYLKLDGCNVDIRRMPQGYPEMGRLLNMTGRPIVYSCSWPAYMIDRPDMVNYNLIGQHCNLWRNFDDISRSWNSIKSIIDYYDHNQDRHIPTHGPGHWHDPDMIIVGNTELTVDQAKAQMTIWSVWSAPLLMSNDLRLIAPVFRRILQNRRVIAVDQDPLGIMGRLVANTTDIGVYVKPMTPYDVQRNRYSYAVAVLNRNMNYQMDVSFVLEKIGLKNPGGYFIEDLWTGQQLGLMRPLDTYYTRVNPTGVDFFKATVSAY